MRVVRVRLAVTMPAMVTLWPSANRTGPSSAEKSSRMVWIGTAPACAGQRPVIRHGVAAEIKARSLLLHEHPLGGGELRNVRQGSRRRRGRSSPRRPYRTDPAGPPRSLRLALAMLSSTFSKTCDQLGAPQPSWQSKAPLRIRFSTARLFMSVQSNIRWQKS